MSKKNFVIHSVSKKQCKPLLEQYHYLSKIQRGFKSGYNYGLFHHQEIVGVCIYTGLPVKELLKGMIGKSFDEDQSGYFELSRLVLTPEIQKTEHNIASWFVARTIKLLRRETEVKLILSYADSAYHNGIVYKALGFRYYGLSAPKKDFWFLLPDGSYKKHSRGPLKGKAGEWRERTRKHRYLKVFDNQINIQWKEQSYPITT